MTKQRRREIFDFLRDSGVKRIVSSFSGGHDEGGPDNIVCYNKNGKEIGCKHEDIVFEILDGIYGGFDDEPIVRGNLIIDVKKETISIKASEGYTEYKNTKMEL